MSKKDKFVFDSKFSSREDSFDIEIIPTKEEIEHEFVSLDEKLNKIDDELAPLTSHADAVDVAISAGIGALASAIDIIFIDHLCAKGIKKWGDNAANDFVKKIAKVMDPEGDYSDVKQAIGRLEKLAYVNYDQAAETLGGREETPLK